MSSLFGRRFIYSLCRNRREIFKSAKFKKDMLQRFQPVVYNTRTKVIFKPMALRQGPQPSRFHPGSAIDQTADFIESVLLEKAEMTHEDWHTFKTDVMLKHENITEKNFGTIVMDSLIYMRKLDLAHSFISYQESGELQPNFLTYLKYISLCSQNHRLVKKELILEKLNKIRYIVDKNMVLDMKTAEYTIQGLCATHKWREAFDYLNKLQNKPSLTIRNALACAAIRNGDIQLAWEILTKLMKPGEIPSDRVVEEFFLQALDMVQKNPAQSMSYVEKVLDFMQLKDIIVDDQVVKLIREYFECHPSKWDISYTKVNRKGECEACGSSLKMSDLTNDEFIFLREEFFNRVVKKSDVYINSNPREFEKFIDFVHSYKPYHVVVDGLNAAYTYPSHPRSKFNVAYQLLNIVKKLAGTSRKVLVLGRKHMRQWPPAPMRKLSEVSRIFFTDNISQDDPFIIYAALASGPHTLFFSLDLMRDHMSRLEDPYTINLFKRWQQSHQIYVNCGENYRIKFTPPLAHSINVQGKMNIGWHIPFDDKIALEPYEELNNWLCIQRDLDLNVIE